MPTPTAVDFANRFRQDLANQEAASAERMARVYSRIYTDLLDQAQRLAEDLSDADNIDQKRVLQFARTRELLRQVREQATRFATTIENEVVVMRGQAAALGVENALKLMEVSLPDGLRGLRGSFARLPADAIEAAAGLTANDSPLMEGLREKYGEYVASQVEEKLLNGIAAGQGPGAIYAALQRNLKEGLGAGLTSALTTIRTAQMTAYRTANHATYLANSKVVKGWVWHAELGPRTCMSCIAQHGSIHPLTETLNDHHNGRCAPLPLTVGYKDLGLDIPDDTAPIETGEAWFGKQPADIQRGMMGPGLFEAWKAGRVGFGDFSQTYNDSIYGEMRRQATLKDMESGASERVRVSKNDYTAGYSQTLKEIEQIKKDGEFYDGELADAQSKLELEREISQGLRGLGLNPRRMTTEDWGGAAKKFRGQAINELTYATQAQREAAGNREVGRQFVPQGERRVVQVGGQDVEQRWTGGSRRAAEQATREINAATKSAAQKYMAGRLREFGYGDAGEMSYDQQRRLLAKIGRGEAGDVTPRQRADALEIAFNPRAGRGLKLWEYYEISMVKAGREAEIEAPPDSREDYIPGFVTGQKKQKPVKPIVQEDEFDF